MVDELVTQSSIALPGLRFRQIVSWIGAVAGALLLNSALFGLMPGLVNRSPEKTVVTDVVPMVNIVRLKQPEPPVHRKQENQQLAQKTLKKPQHPKKSFHKRKPAPKSLKIPFDIDPSLPAGPGTIPVLPMETVSVDAPELKSSYDIGEIDSGLMPLAKAPPLYPMRARRRGIEGWVTVRFVVNEQGRVENINITAAEPETIFDQSVRQCVSGWRFTAGNVAGIPVKTRVETTIRFELK